jgi:hypothetical protein
MAEGSNHIARSGIFYLNLGRIDASFDPAYHLKYVDTIFRRIFGEDAVSTEGRDELAAQ